MPDRAVLQYDENMNLVHEYHSQKETAEKTGITDYRIRKSINKNIPIDGFYFKFKEELKPWYTDEICYYCGSTFKCSRNRKSHKLLFCCKKCEGEYRKTLSDKNCQCVICGKMFHLKPSAKNRYEHHTCSKECLKILKSNIMAGSNNHQFGLKGRLNSSWKSDERITEHGYKKIRILEHPFHDLGGFVLEHRLVAEKYLLNNANSVEIDGIKYLSDKYIVHHLDFDRLNNDVSNLYVIERGIHTKFHLKYKDKSKTMSKDELKNLFFDFLIANYNNIDNVENYNYSFGNSNTN